MGIVPTVQARQDGAITKELIEQVITQQAIDGHKVHIVHTDNGKVMASNPMKTMLQEKGVELSLIHSNVSNDNPFEESSHRTLRHHRHALEIYPTLQDSYRTVAKIVEEHNFRDRHIGLNDYTPQEVYTGQ